MTNDLMDEKEFSNRTCDLDEDEDMYGQTGKGHPKNYDFDHSNKRERDSKSKRSFLLNQSMNQPGGILHENNFSNLLYNKNTTQRTTLTKHNFVNYPVPSKTTLTVKT
jgi:hypothetical protein